MDRDDSAIKKPRRSGVDAFRLLCALGVLAGHAAVFEGEPHVVWSLLSKWMVAYFFIVLGYFLGKKSGSYRTSHALTRIFLMYLVASVVMLPLSLVRVGVRETCTYVLEHFLTNGSYFHLWYLNSLIFGLLVVRLTDAGNRRAWLPIIAVVAMVTSLWLGSYATEDTRFFGRHLMSIPLLWIGMLLSRGVPSVRQSLALVILGLGIESIESWVLHVHFAKDVWRCPYLIGTLPLAVGMFGLAFRIPYSRVSAKLGELGARYAGSVYVTQIYFLGIANALADTEHIRQSLAFRVLEVPLIFLINLAALRLVDHVAPKSIDALLGDGSALRWSLRSLVSMPTNALRAARSFVSG